MSLSFLAAAREVPNRTAVVRKGESYTFSEFLPFVAGAMRRLASLGLRPGVDARAVLVASPHLETLANIYALIELGVPIVLLHDRLTERERSAIVEECRPAIVIDDPPAVEAASPPPPAPPEPDPWERAREPVPDDGRPLVILYTSGTGGRPKGVVLSRAAFVASAAASAANLGWEDGDLWAIALPLGHVGGFSIVTRCLLARRPVLLAAPFDAASLARAIDERRVTLLSLVPAMVRRLLDHDPSWGPPRALRAVLVGGGPLSEALLEEALARGLRLLPSYGLTETCSQIAAWPYGTRPTAPIARALAAAELRIREGRILVRGPMLLTSYFPQGAHPCPFIEDGWLETSDFGEIDESGFLRVLGRADELLVTGGENVSPFEIEAEIERFPGVRAACVFGVREDPWGDVIAVAIVLAPGTALDSELLAAHLARALAPHKRPRRFALVPSLPLAPSGKVDRAAVAARSPLLLLPLRPRGEPFSTRSDP